MNRRSFITRALTGLASIPLLGRLNGRACDVQEPSTNAEPTYTSTVQIWHGAELYDLRPKPPINARFEGNVITWESGR